MVPQTQVMHTKLAPPRPQKYTLARPRLTAQLLDAQNHRLTIVQAGTGYGKSTALAALAQEEIPIIWYRLDDEDADPHLFLLHLIHSTAVTIPNMSQTPLALLEEWNRQRTAARWTAVIDALLNEISQRQTQPTLLIIDDVHHLQESGDALRILDRFIGRAPAHLHIILASRYPLSLPSLVNWRVKGELLEIGQAELAFTPHEISQLFHDQYAYALTVEQASLLVNRIEGWPIALHLIWQRLKQDGGASLSSALWQLSGSASDLFTYLTQEVLARQPADLQQFLTTTAVLRVMTPVRCDYLRNANDSQQILRYLLEKGLFVVNLGHDQVRYHRLFRELLQNQVPAAERQRNHRQAAYFFRQQGDSEETIYHLLAGAAHAEAADLLETIGRAMVRGGRLDTLANWIGELPPDILTSHPPLLVYLGDIARLHSRFEEALAWYQQAEQHSRTQSKTPALSQALRGQARVYLDLVNPARAEVLLQEALRLSDGSEDRESRARLLELLAENLLNQGKADEAEQYQTQARSLRDQGHGTAELPVRLLLRTGRLAEARTILEELAQAEEESPVLRPRAHRETQLLLSLVYTFMGAQAAAQDTAVTGTERGQALDSHFITSVGYSRQGHAWNLQKDAAGFEQAQACFQAAIGISQRIDVPRLQVEPFWGLCQIHGFQGDIDTAVSLAHEAIDILRADGDEWVEMCIRTTMGAALALARQWPQAVDWLTQAATGFRECSDTFGETAARLWLCTVWQGQDDETRLARDLRDVLHSAQTHHYDFLFTRQTLFGPPDPRLWVPVLLFARDQSIHPAYVETLLSAFGLTGIERHPGYQLRLQTLGTFRVWRGGQEILPSEWKRKKARQLFLLLLTHRNRSLHRDQIAELLWPDLSPDGAARDFKIAFSAMCNVLEPGRKRNAPSAYILRDGGRYGLNLEADIWLDAEQFEQAITAGDHTFETEPATAVTYYQTALSLYESDFLQAYPYEEWCQEERQRLRSRCLQTAERVAAHYLHQQQWENAIPLCQKMIHLDDCWEPAYQILMTAYQQQGQRTQAIRTYQQCVAALKKGLGVPPTAVTTHLYQTLTNTEPA